MFRIPAEAYGEPEGSSEERVATSEEHIVTREETTVARLEHADRSEVSDMTDDKSVSTAGDCAAVRRKTADACGNPDTSVRVAPCTRHHPGQGVRLRYDISDDSYMIGPRPTRMATHHGTVVRVTRDASGNAERMRQRTAPIGHRTPRGDLRTRNASGNSYTVASASANTSDNTDTMGAQRVDASGNTYGSVSGTLSHPFALRRDDDGRSRAATDTADHVEVHPLALPCQAHVH